MFPQAKNKVAKILKIYAVFNVIGGIIVSIILSDELPGDIASIFSWSFFAAVVVISFGIYAFGEVVDLLNQIKDNTKAANPKKEEEDLSEILPNL